MDAAHQDNSLDLPAADAPAPATGPPAGRELLDRLDAAAAATARLEDVCRENESLAEEVLRTYEQLNVLLDFTQQIAAVTRRDETQRMLLNRLGDVLRVDAVDVFVSDGAWRRYATAGGPPQTLDGRPDEATAALVERTRNSRSMSVAPLVGGSALVGALPRLENQVNVVCAVRPPGAPEFTSGDLRLAETLLAFGGQLLANTELHERLRTVSMETTRALVAAIDKKDRYTSGHSERVGFLSRLVGERLGLPREQVEQLEWAGLLHDIGKIGVPEEILNKAGKLTPDEYEQIKKHPEMGHEILKHIHSFEQILDGVLYHHENPNGAGYPRGLRDAEIPLAAAIIHVVDVFDALSSTRSYRPRFTIDHALEVLRSEAGTVLNADLVGTFIAALSELRAAQPDLFARTFPHLLEAQA